jgi:pimeloyl-ACP methyl ester carboxylesterase
MILATGAAVALGGAGAAANAQDFTSDRIDVRVEGSGPDVVLIHGLSSHPDVWKSTVAAVPGYRYHLVHIAGMGGLAPGANAQGPVVAPTAEEIARYIQVAGLQRPAIVGHSMGGEIALMIAARHSASVGKVMVVDMLPFMGVMFGPPPMTPEKARPVADQIRAQMLKAPLSDYHAFAGRSLEGMIRTEALRPQAMAHMKAGDRRAAANAFHELVVTDLTPELANITVPVTVIYARGDNAPVDEATMDAIYRAAYAGLKGVRLKRIPNAWHFIMWDQPEAFQSELKAFLAG